MIAGKYIIGLNFDRDYDQCLKVWGLQPPKIVPDQQQTSTLSLLWSIQLQKGVDQITSSKIAAADEYRVYMFRVNKITKFSVGMKIGFLRNNKNAFLYASYLEIFQPLRNACFGLLGA